MAIYAILSPTGPPAPLHGVPVAEIKKPLALVRLADPFFYLDGSPNYLQGETWEAIDEDLSGEQYVLQYSSPGGTPDLVYCISTRELVKSYLMT